MSFAVSTPRLVTPIRSTTTVRVLQAAAARGVLGSCDERAAASRKDDLAMSLYCKKTLENLVQLFGDNGQHEGTKRLFKIRAGLEEAGFKLDNIAFLQDAFNGQDVCGYTMDPFYFFYVAIPK